MAETGERMHAEYDNEHENVVNKNTIRQPGVTITYKQKSRYDVWVIMRKGMEI